MFISLSNAASFPYLATFKRNGSWVKPFYSSAFKWNDISSLLEVLLYVLTGIKLIEIQ